MSGKVDHNEDEKIDLNQEETKLAATLRHEYCDDDGKETNQQESGKIFHELGLIYLKRSADKLSSIRSAALLVAAQIRCPEKCKNIQDDLEALWLNVLVEAKAKTTQISLEVISNDFKQKVSDMRSWTRGKMQLIPKHIDYSEADEIPEDYDTIMRTEEEGSKARLDKIACVESLQNEVTDRYCSVMNYLANQIFDNILNAAPCKFAFVGLGSLAKKEITPYSDFECIIVLEDKVEPDEDTLDFFRWFAIIFHIVLISLGETILPNLAISCLNDFYHGGDDWFYDDVTPSGIHFDGFMPFACKTPMGRQDLTAKKTWKTEFIKPVNQMLKYLCEEEILKNGYHIADVLAQTCYVAGDEQLYRDFEDQVHEKLETQRQNDNRYFERLEEIVKNDLTKYDVVHGSLIPSIPTGNFATKSLFYRSITIFISAFGKYQGFRSFSSFDIIRELQARELLSENDALYLSYAVAISCELRIKDCEHPLSSGNIVEKLVEVIGERSVVECLATAMSVQKCRASFTRENLVRPLVLTGFDLRKILVSIFGFSWNRRAVRYSRITLSEVEVNDRFLMEKVCASLGWSLFSAYDAENAKTKFSELIFEKLSRQGITGTNYFEYCQALYGGLLSRPLNENMIRLDCLGHEESGTSSSGTESIGQRGLQARPTSPFANIYKVVTGCFDNPNSSNTNWLLSLVGNQQVEQLFSSHGDKFNELQTFLLGTIGQESVSAEDSRLINKAKGFQLSNWNKSFSWLRSGIGMFRFRGALLKLKLEIDENLNAQSFNLD